MGFSAQDAPGNQCPEALRRYGASSLICLSNQARSCFQTALSGESFVKRASPFSPRGRRWREAPDEGVFPAALSPGLCARSQAKEPATTSRAFPFIARSTRAYLNFEVKDAPKARGQSKSDLSDFDISNAGLGKSRDRFRP
jgi:hypothetical protein